MKRDRAKGEGQVLRCSSQLIAQERWGQCLWDTINVSELVSKDPLTLSFVVDSVSG